VYSCFGIFIFVVSVVTAILRHRWKTKFRGKLKDLIVGSRIVHPVHGAGTVTFVGTDYLGIAFDAGGEALVRRESLDAAAPVAAEPQAPTSEALPWPDSTFVPERDDAEHSLGLHWRPFAEDAKDILSRIPEMLPAALLQTGYGETRKPSRAEPEGWAKGLQLVWPLRTHGLALILRLEAGATALVSLFPFNATGSQQTLTVEEVVVWKSGVEAQITTRWGDSEVTFFDSQYLINRTWYEAGKDYDFILSGMAYAARPAEQFELPFQQHPDVVAWTNRHLPEGAAPFEAESTLSLGGMAVFMPIPEWDADDYGFRGPVKSVKEFRDWLGQDGWRVRTTVMRFDDEDADLDILITRRAWSGTEPPRAGQEIEGELWLQGYLWMPR
jgi:hypothetical protein